MKRLEVPLKGLNVHLRTTSVWPLLLKGLSKLIRQNLHLELIGCIHLENWTDPEQQGFCFILISSPIQIVCFSFFCFLKLWSYKARKDKSIMWQIRRYWRIKTLKCHTDSGNSCRDVVGIIRGGDWLIQCKYWLYWPELLLEVSGHLWTATAVEQLWSHMHLAAEVWPGKEKDRKLGPY